MRKENAQRRAETLLVDETGPHGRGEILCKSNATRMVTTSKGRRAMGRFALAAISVVIGTLLVSCGGKHGSPESHGQVAPVKTKIETLAKQTVEVPREAVGTVRSKTMTAIQSKLTAHVTAVNVREGDAVSVGQVLIELDAREVAAQTDKAAAGLSEAQRALDEASRAIDAATSGKAAAEAARDLAQATYNRYRGLFDSSAVSRQMLDEADAKRKAADADALQAADMVRSAEARRAGVQAQIAQAQADVANVKVAMGFSKLESPIAGIVTRKSVDIGDLASPGAVLLEIEDDQQYRLEANVDETQLGGLHVGDQVKVILDALGSAELAGAVSEIVPSVDPTSRTFQVKVDLVPEPRLHSGVFGRLHFAASAREILTIPKASLYERGQLTGVYVVSADNIARLRLIKTGKEYGDRIEVLSGLDGGERIVVDNLAQVTDGCTVEY